MHKSAISQPDVRLGNYPMMEKRGRKRFTLRIDPHVADFFDLEVIPASSALSRSDFMNDLFTSIKEQYPEGLPSSGDIPITLPASLMNAHE